VTGFGHLYLRRWRRAVGWLAVLFAVSYAFVDPAAIEALAAGEPVDPLSIAPTLLVGSLSVIDAYVLARAQNEVARTRGAAESAKNPGEAVDSCPNCGKDVDPGLDFCHWCTADLQGGAETDFEDAESERSERR